VKLSSIPNGTSCPLFRHGKLQTYLNLRDTGLEYADWFSTEVLMGSCEDGDEVLDSTTVGNLLMSCMSAVQRIPWNIRLINPLKPSGNYIYHQL
jgi:hypothetical protein